MKVLAINNGRERTAFSFVEGNKKEGYWILTDFMAGDITKQIKNLYNFFEPEEIIVRRQRKWESRWDI